MIDINILRSTKPRIVCIGSYPTIIQSILDFDFIAGNKPSIDAIIASGRKFERYFFGKKEIFIPVYSSFEIIPQPVIKKITVFINLSSSRRVLSLSKQAIDTFPNLLGGVVFAEEVPEKHAVELYHYANKKNKFVIGPASVGLMLPGLLKLGAIGGTEAKQLVDSHLFTPGSIAVFSASGGMTNEIIRIVTTNGKRLSFSFSFGGDRYPMTSPKDALLAAENDKTTKAIVYFGELGGVDEYEIARLIQDKVVTKPVICYIAGVVSDLFETPPQFGHAKAMAGTQKETARAKRDALANAGAQVAESFSDFIKLIQNIPGPFVQEDNKYCTIQESMTDRTRALIATSISKDEEGVVKLLGVDLLDFAKSHSFAAIVTALFLGKKDVSLELEKFVDFTLRLLVDHGPYVSGAVNTIITARAGRDMVSSLATGLLTIGPRFGGAINQAAANWHEGVKNDKDAGVFVEEFASKKKYISGIGHRKYRVDFPDPRVIELLSYADSLKNKKYTTFAKEVEKVTVAKKGNLILNVDGAIAAVMLDLLAEKENVSDDAIQQLIDSEFFNAFFILSRSVGFLAHFLDQKRLDEGLFRLEEDQVADASAR